ncbi:anaerobic sulfite reductase subunit AsrB [Selenihalanaerobacter shriftii]|uniref:Anaerobic sulfite reductase subunit B n=1 Tax=Selenihalanaerobacter shriftii TaxID=142842 RepID=A0A1T4LQ80_9FIRM|nr:anaerobic sulfite reductase subunit AsrB [Selenihalanaerobacter shriftii]SJZ56797.1 anaerobic sulfite reductase subunit B [Selenihalanaerobacter shriftii]
MSNNPYLPEHAEVIDIIQETDVEYTFRLDTELEPTFGQFLEVSIPGYGEAPISVSDFGDGWLDLTIRRVGKLTDKIHELKIGDHLGIRGPYGNGFPIDKFKNKDLVIAAGGTGLAPVRSMINYFYNNLDDLKQFNLLTGFKNSESILFKRDIDNWKESIDLLITVDEGTEKWEGNTGLITEYVPQIEISAVSDMEVVVVGPPIMMKYTVKEFKKLGIPEEQIWVSYERKMHCGLGKCGHCKIDDTYICLEGPVFNYSEAKELID